MTAIVVEPLQEYDILLNEEDEILIAIRARLGGVSKPQLLYDGKDKIVLYRNEDQTIYLTEVPEPVRKPLEKLSKVLMIEVHDDAIIREYMAPIKVVSHIPSPTGSTL